MKPLKTNARITEVADVGARLLILLGRETTPADDKILKPLFVEIQTLTDQLSQAIKSDRALSQLDEADTLRDDVIRRIGKILQGYVASPITSIQQAATKLNTVFEKYGVSVARENYATESAHIESLLKDFANPSFSEYIKILPGVTEIIAMLAAAQKDFNDHRVTYEQALAFQSSQLKSAELKKRLLQRINASLLPYLGSLKSLNQKEYFPFIEGVSQIISNTNSGITARSKKPDNTTKPI